MKNNKYVIMCDCDDVLNNLIEQTCEVYNSMYQSQISIDHIHISEPPENAKCEKYYTPEQDGLLQPWYGICWCNPPYGREIGKWVKRAHDYAMNGVTTVMLLPARTDTKWFHDYILNTQREVRYIRGRLKFGKAKNNAPFPSMIVIFKPNRKDDESEHDAGRSDYTA